MPRPFLFFLLVLLCICCYACDAAVVSHTLIIEEHIVHGKPTVTVNGSSPGPSLFFDENDTISITVINNLENRTTTIHWHGLYQYGTPFYDGAVGVTQCGIPTQQRMTYRFKATPSGTYWYHGHVGGQLVSGLYGALIIRSGDDAAAASTYGYGNNEWVWIVSDWYQDSVATLTSYYQSTQNQHGLEPVPDGILLNQDLYRKTNDAAHHNATTSMSLPHLYIGNNDTLRIRIINAAALSMFSISIDSLALTVIEVDGVSVLPLSLSSVMVDAGQRVSVIVKISEWKKALPQSWVQQQPSSLHPRLYARIESMTSMWGMGIENGADHDGHGATDLSNFRPYYNPDWQYDPIMLVAIHTDPTDALQDPVPLPTYNASSIKPQPGVNVVMPMPYNETGPMSADDMHMMTAMGIDENLLAARPTRSMPAPIPSYWLYLEISKEVHTSAPQPISPGHDAKFNGPRYYVNRNSFTLENNPSTVQPILYQLVTQAFQATNTSTSTTTHQPPATSPPTSSSTPSNPHAGHGSGSTDGSMPPMSSTGSGAGPTTHSMNNENVYNRTLVIADRFTLPWQTTIEILINNTDSVSHPMHMHGYHFWVVSTSSDWSESYGPNFVRRDTAVVPAYGWIKIRIFTDNPGLWLLHCHMEWHMMAGLSTMLVTGFEYLPQLLRTTLPPKDEMESCLSQVALGWVLSNSTTSTDQSSTGTNGSPSGGGGGGGGHGGHNFAPSNMYSYITVVTTVLFSSLFLLFIK